MAVFFALLAACLVLSGADAQRTTYESIYAFAHSRSDLQIYSLGVDMFPDIALRFADPTLNITTFIPTDAAIRMGMKMFYGLKDDLTNYDALKVMYRNNQLLYPQIVPDALSGLSALAQNSILWTVISNHAIEVGGARTLQELVPNQWYPSGLPYLAQGLPPQQLRVHPGLRTVESYLVSSANILESNIRCGNSIVHLVDSNLWPNETLNPFNSIRDIFNNPSTADTVIFPQIMERAAKAVNGAVDIINPSVPLTVFVATDVAITNFLGKIGMSLNKLLSSKRLCSEFIRAHVVSAIPATGGSMYLWHLITLGGIDMSLRPALLPADIPGFLQGLDGLPRRNYIYNMLNQELKTATPINQFTKGTTTVGFGDGPMGSVLKHVNFGGTVYITAGVGCITHKIDTVLINNFA